MVDRQHESPRIRERRERESLIKKNPTLGKVVASGCKTLAKASKLCRPHLSSTADKAQANLLDNIGPTAEKSCSIAAARRRTLKLHH